MESLPTKMNNKCAIVILNWNHLEDTIDCVQSVLQSDYSNYEILVADNGYDTAYPDILRKLFPQIVVVENKKNLGFAEGNNRGIQAAFERGADYVFILNNDTLISKTAIKNLVHIFKSEPKIGVVGAITWEYTIPYQHQNSGGHFNASTGKLDWFSAIAKNSNVKDNRVDVDYVYGSAMCIRREMVNEVGLFDRNYFLYYEDIEWCYRAKTQGWRVVIGLDVFVWHKMGALVSEILIRPLSGYYSIRNLNSFINTYGSFGAKCRMNLENIKLFMKMQFSLLKAQLVFSENTSCDYAYRQGILDFYLRRKGEQNTWKRKQRNGHFQKNLESGAFCPTQKQSKFRVFVPLPDLTCKQLESMGNQLTDWARQFPDVEFILWIYPPNWVDEKQVLQHNENYDLFSEGWLPPEKWYPNLTIRWVQSRAYLDLMGKQFNRIVLRVQPKVSRLVKMLTLLFPRFPIRGLRSTFLVNGMKILDVQWDSWEFKIVELAFLPADSIHLELQSTKSYRYGIFNHRRISLAVSRIETFTTSEAHSKTVPLVPSSIVSEALDKFINRMEQFQNVCFLPPETIRDMAGFYSSLDVAIIYSPEKIQARLGILFACCRNGIPVLATRDSLGNLPLEDHQDLLIIMPDNAAEVLQSFLQSDNLKTTLPNNMKEKFKKHLGLVGDTLWTN